MHFDYNNVYESYAVNIFKNRPLKNLNRGALAGAGSAFGHTCSVTQDYDVCQLQRNTAQFHRWDTGALFFWDFQEPLLEIQNEICRYVCQGYALVHFFLFKHIFIMFKP